MAFRTEDYLQSIVRELVILNGSPRKNGKTASLVKAFVEGAEFVGNEVKELYLQGMNIGGCLACEGCQRNGGVCVQKDDMQIVSEAFLWADVVVFASPQYWGIRNMRSINSTRPTNYMPGY